MKYSDDMKVEAKLSKGLMVWARRKVDGEHGWDIGVIQSTLYIYMKMSKLNRIELQGKKKKSKSARFISLTFHCCLLLSASHLPHGILQATQASPWQSWLTETMLPSFSSSPYLQSYPWCLTLPHKHMLPHNVQLMLKWFSQEEMH